MNVHEQFADDLSLYALGALVGEDRLALERHLEECPACRHEVEQLRGDWALLGLSASGPEPLLHCRARLMAAIADEPRRTQVHLPKRKTLWSVLEWGAAVVALVVLVLLLRENTDLKKRLEGLQAHSINQQQQLVQAKELIATLTSADALHFTLVAGKIPPQPQGKAIYVRSTGTLVFLASNMPKLPPQQIYELWLIPTTGAPIPAGVFRPDTHGSAALIKPPLPAGVQPTTFAITVEPSAGSAAPTSTPIMVGIGG
jgi:anti-sigma-K factor RskA